MTEISKEVIKENIERIEEGKALTMPLAVLNGELKKRYFSKAYCEKNKDRSEQKKAYYEKNKDKIKTYREKNKDKIAEQRKACYERNKELRKNLSRSDKLRLIEEKYSEVSKPNSSHG